MKLKYLTIFFFIALIILTPSLTHALMIEKPPSLLPLPPELSLFPFLPYSQSLSSWALDKIANPFFAAISYVFVSISSFVIGWILRFSSLFLEWAINPGIGSITEQPFVVSGVLITRSIANLVLIAILLTISIATIIGIESYGIRKALPMLIGVALLINFSSVITGLVIDAGQVPLEFFTKKAFPPDFSIGMAFQKSLHLDDFAPNFNVTGEDKGLLDRSFSFSDTASNFIISLFMIIIGLLASFMFFKLGILLLLRYVAFWILIILAPFVFAISVFPSTRKYLTKWFTHLLEWSFLGVIATFFIYLALLVLVSFDISSSVIFKEKIGKGGGFMGNFGITLISLFTVYFFLQYGYNISKKMAGEGAMAIVNGIGNIIKSGALMAGAGALGGVGFFGKGALKKGIGMFVKQKDNEKKTLSERGEAKMRDMGAYLQTSRVFSRIGGNRVGQFMMGEQGFTEKELKEIAAKKTAWAIRIKGMTKEEIEKLLKSITIPRKDKAALSYAAIEKKLLTNEGAELVNKLAKFDEKLNVKLQEKYGHIIGAMNASGGIDSKKMNERLEENRNDISKLDLTSIGKDSNKDALDSIIMKTSGQTLSDMNIRNPESIKIIQSRIKEIRESKDKDDIIKGISEKTGKSIKEVEDNIELINIQNTEMGAGSRFGKGVWNIYQDKVKVKDKDKDKDKDKYKYNYKGRGGGRGKG